MSEIDFSFFRDVIISPRKKSSVGITTRGVVAPLDSIPSDVLERMYEAGLAELFKHQNNSCGINLFGTNFRLSCGNDISMYENFEEFKAEYPSLYFRVPSSLLLSPKELGYPLKLMAKLNVIKSGLILFCGDQGSGKTTGMTSLLKERIFQKGGTAVTFEAPPEYDISGALINEGNNVSGFINQIAVATEKDFSKAAAISLRMASPNVVMYGEIRSEHGVREIISNSLSSHVVMTTIHGCDISASIRRFLDMAVAGRPDYREYYARMFSDSFKFCLHQRLIQDSHGKTQLCLTQLENDEEVRQMLYRGNFNSLREVVERQYLRERESEEN